MAETFASSPTPAVTRAATASPREASTNASSPSGVAHETACVVASASSRRGRGPGRSILLRTTTFAPRSCPRQRPVSLVALRGGVEHRHREVPSSLARPPRAECPPTPPRSVVSRTPAVSATITLYPPEFQRLLHGVARRPRVMGHDRRGSTREGVEQTALPRVRRAHQRHSNAATDQLPSRRRSQTVRPVRRGGTPRRARRRGRRRRTPVVLGKVEGRLDVRGGSNETSASRVPSPTRRR